MPTNTGTVKIEIRVDDKGTVKVKQFGDQMDKTGRKGDQSFKRTGKSVGDFNKKLTATHSNVLKLVAAFGGFMIIRSSIRWINDFMEAAGKQQQSVAGMEQAMRSMGRYTPKLSAELIGLAQGLQKVTTFGDEATIEGTKFLLTYKDITDNLLPRSIKTMLDLAALMGGDTRQAANMLGKASMGLAGELRRVGITIDETIGKSGDFSAILGEIEKQVGGQAEALARTGYGGLIQLRNLTGDAKEQFGELALKIGQAGVFDLLKENLMGVTDKMERWIEQNEAIIKQKVPEYIERIITALKKIWEIMSYDPDIIKYGIVGLALWGRKGAVLLGSLAHMKNWVSNLSKALGMASAGVLEFSEIATANFKELEELVKKGERLMQGPFFKGKIIAPTVSEDSVKQIQEATKNIEDLWQKWGTGASEAEESLKRIHKQIAQLPEALDMDEFTKQFEMAEINKKIAGIAKDIVDDIRDNTKETVNEMEEIYKNFIHNIQNEFADTFYDIFSGQLDSFDDFLDSMKKAFLRMLAEMAAAAAMKQITLNMSTSMGGASGLSGGAQGTGTGTQMPSWVATLGAYGMAAYMGYSFGQMVGGWMGLGKEKDARYKFDPATAALAKFTPGTGYETANKFYHQYGKGEEITDAVQMLFEQITANADAMFKGMPKNLQEKLEPYLKSIVFKPTDYNFKFKNAEQVIQAMAEKWTAQVEEAFNAAARATGNASFAEMLAWEDISWQAKIMGGAVTPLEIQIHDINVQFDAWIQQLKDLGSSEERLAEIEKYREMALKNLTAASSLYERQIESLQATLLNLATSMDSPLDAEERMALIKKEINALMAGDMTPEDVSKIQALWMNYLRVAQEMYQRPSVEYQAIYTEVTGALNELIAWLKAMKEYQSGGYVAETGPAIVHRGERVVPAGEGSSVVVNFQPSIRVDGSRDSMRASREITAEFEHFMRGRGRKIVQEVVKYY